MQNHNDDTIKTSDSVLRKINLSFYMKGLCVRGSWRPNITATYWPPTLLVITAFLSRSPGLLNRGPGGPASLGAGFLYRILSPTRVIPNSQSGAWGLPRLGAGFFYRIWLQLVWSLQTALSYIIVQRPLSSCGRHKLHSFNPSTVKDTLCYSSTGCTCYLHRCISYFDSPAGS